MGIKSSILDALNSLFKHFGYELINDQWHTLYKPNLRAEPEPQSPLLPTGASEYLVMNNPMLRDLSMRYEAFDNRVTTPLKWTESFVNPDNMLYFRGNNPYVWQLKGMNTNRVAYALTAYYARSIDTLGLLDRLEEDNFFGAITYAIADKAVSRDLLDSIIEYYFLEKHLNISTATKLTILDIGAGYGRMAHRMAAALPNLSEYLCVDAYPISTFISEYYLQFRNLDSKVKVIPLDEIEIALAARSVDIAVNIHSFPECRISAIEWWLSLLAKHRVQYLMIVPNIGDSLQTHDGHDFKYLISKHGYKQIAKEPKYRDPVVQQYALMPVYHYLFELSPAG